MAQVGVEDPKARLEKIKRQLSAGSGSVLLHGLLLKRSETLRKWNQRWLTLDPSTGKMEYRYILIKGDLHLPEYLMKWCF